jgi:hypothetical protein
MTPGLPKQEEEQHRHPRYFSGLAHTLYRYHTETHCNPDTTAGSPLIAAANKYYAYVYSINLTTFTYQVFWSAPSGTDSKAGTLIHEMSHFDVVAATDDVVYGQAGARLLADTNPDAAITNADSHEYFAENTPPLP